MVYLKIKLIELILKGFLKKVNLVTYNLKYTQRLKIHLFKEEKLIGIEVKYISKK